MNAWDGFFLFPCIGFWGVNIDKVLKRIVMDGWVDYRPLFISLE